MIMLMSTIWSWTQAGGKHYSGYLSHIKLHCICRNRRKAAWLLD